MSKKNRVRVAHDYEDFQEDKEVILVIQDSNILDSKGETVLENPQIAQNYRSEFHKKIQEKLSGDQDPDDPFFRGKILPKYDEYKPEKEGFFIDEEGDTEKDESSVLDSINKKLGIKSDKGIFSLEVVKKAGSDYMTEEEYRGFSKKKKKQKSAIRDFSFLNDMEREEQEREELGKRDMSQRRNDNVDEEREKKIKGYKDTMNAASEHLKGISHFKEEKNREDEEELYLLENMIRNNRKLAEEKAKKAEDRLKFLMRKDKEVVNEDTREVLPSLNLKGSKEKDDGVDFKKIIEKAKKINEDPFKRPEK